MKLSAIITPVNTKFGAPMGRPNVGAEPLTVCSGRNNRICKKHQTKIYQKHVPLTDGYDAGGAYWGIGKPLMVRFTKDLSFIEFFRMP